MFALGREHGEDANRVDAVLGEEPRLAAQLLHVALPGAQAGGPETDGLPIAADETIAVSALLDEAVLAGRLLVQRAEIQHRGGVEFVGLGLEVPGLTGPEGRLRLRRLLAGLILAVWHERAGREHEAVHAGIAIGTLQAAQVPGERVLALGQFYRSGVEPRSLAGPIRVGVGGDGDRVLALVDRHVDGIFAAVNAIGHARAGHGAYPHAILAGRRSLDRVLAAAGRLTRMGETANPLAAGERIGIDVVHRGVVHELFLDGLFTLHPDQRLRGRRHGGAAG